VRDFWGDHQRKEEGTTSFRLEKVTPKGGRRGGEGREMFLSGGISIMPGPKKKGKECSRLYLLGGAIPIG